MNKVAVVVGWLMICCGGVRAQTFWVDAANGNDAGFPGTESQPFATINRAVDRAKVENGATIKVINGVYDWTHEDGYTGGLGTPRDPFPIVLDLDGIAIQGQDPDREDFPVVGGGLPSNQDVEALLIIEGAVGGRANLDIERLRFAGSDVANRDAPAALLALVGPGQSISASSRFGDNVCERGEMNASGSDGNPTLLLRVTEGTLLMVIEDNIIEASERGAIEIVAIAGEIDDEDQLVNTRATVRRNRLSLDEGETALFGFRWIAQGLGGEFGTWTSLDLLDGTEFESPWLPGQPPTPGFDPPSVDFDYDNRIQDGDYPCTGHLVPKIDMGADEVPQPECP